MCHVRLNHWATAKCGNFCIPATRDQHLQHQTKERFLFFFGLLAIHPFSVVQRL